jgi:uncharacterized lipoprotein YddW (UPF0748 family)
MLELVSLAQVKYFITLLVFIIQTLSYAQPKFEFRGAWIATIGGIDFPNPNTRSDANAVQQEYINILNHLDDCGINAVVVQVRPAADAFYASTYEPWSKYCTGTQGMPPSPFYDPLQFMIKEAHKRGMEFHAWFNPYRALVDATKNPNPSTHITYQHPEWFINYGGKRYFNPGLPAVRQYVYKVVCEVVEKYDIDAVHFDDYFYPYRIAGKEFPDQGTFLVHGNNYINKNDWRRYNVNIFIEEISAKIKAIKPYVKLGISPFGVWRNKSKDPDGSPTQGGQTNYDDLYADVLLWLKNKWVDYMLPQLYWEQSHTKVGFNTLLDWWSTHSYGRAMYIGHGLYQVANNKAAAWHNPAEIEQQVYAVRANKNVQGSCYYSTAYFFKNKLGVIDRMKNSYNKTKSIVPPMPWIDKQAPMPPKVLSAKLLNNMLSISVKPITEDSKYYVLYRFDKNEAVDISKPDKIMRTTDEATITIEHNGNYKYTITCTDRLHNESVPVDIIF